VVITHRESSGCIAEITWEKWYRVHCSVNAAWQDTINIRNSTEKSVMYDKKTVREAVARQVLYFPTSYIVDGSRGWTEFFGICEVKYRISTVIQYRRVTNTRTDRQTDDTYWQQSLSIGESSSSVCLSRSCIASKLILPLRDCLTDSSQHCRLLWTNRGDLEHRRNILLHYSPRWSNV